MSDAIDNDNDDDHEPGCPRCKCCGMSWEWCETCGGDGVDGHDCGEDTCCCLHPEDNMVCIVCDGKGGWYLCSCDENGKHAPMPKGTPVRPAAREGEG